MTFEDFKDQLDKATTEETVKSIYSKYFKISYDTLFKHDLYTEQVLFEFKHDKNLGNIKSLATTLAQTLYYIYKIKFRSVDKKIPFFICIADKNEALITQTSNWSTYYSSDAYDWERPASKPDPKLIDHLVKEPETSKLHIYKINQKGEHAAFKKNLENALNPQMIIDFGDKKVINEENFEAVFNHWKEIIGKHIQNGYKDSFYFLANIQRDRVILDKDNNRGGFYFRRPEFKNSKSFDARLRSLLELLRICHQP